jgi:hypothetical protein
MRSIHPEGVDWNGQWHGYYKYSKSHPLGWLTDREFSFTANLIQQGAVLKGTIIDEDTHLDLPFRDYLGAISNHLDDQARRNYEDFLSMYPDARFVVSLPRQASLNGRVSKDKIVFTKRYLSNGGHYLESGGERISGSETQNPPIEYSGTIDSRNAVIVGRWVIYQKTFFGIFRRPDGEGSFRLYRSLEH